MRDISRVQCKQHPAPEALGCLRAGSNDVARLFPLALATIFMLGSGDARSEPTPEAESFKPIEIKIETSRTKPTVGTGLGMQAEIKNTSSVNIYLQEQRVTLSIPPELQGPFAGTSTWWGLFPTQHKFPEFDAQNKPTTKEKWDGTVMIKPGGSYRVVWTSSPDISSAGGSLAFIKNMFNVVASELNFIFFSPGDYKISVVAQYWTLPNFPPDDYRTTTQTETVNVSAPQSVILFGSALGGLVAYFIFPYRRREDDISKQGKPTGFIGVTKNVVKGAAGISGAMLLSAITTILLARISETQFLVRVTIADFWGAIAIGFIANYVGVKVFEKILPLKENQETDAAKTGAGKQVATAPENQSKT